MKGSTGVSSKRSFRQHHVLIESQTSEEELLVMNDDEWSVLSRGYDNHDAPPHLTFAPRLNSMV
jgi:hypothetical protein